MAYRRPLSELESTDPDKSRKESVGRIRENRGNRGGEGT
jgi:hypothetical protein